MIDSRPFGLLGLETAMVRKGAGMFRWSHFYSEDMALILVIWVCTLPLVTIIVAPLFGSRVALISDLLLLVLMMGVCWSICGWKLVKGKKERVDRNL